MKFFIRALLLAVLSIAVFPFPVSADWRAFIPRPYRNGADLDVFASYESDDNRVQFLGSEWKDIFVKEKLTLFSDGYVYHPRFILYHFSLAGALRQENYTTTVIQPHGYRNDSGIEYNARVFVLPEHPYTLELFALRYEPLYKEHSAIQHNTVETSKGVLFRYRRKPYFFHTDFIDDTIETTVYSTNVKTLGIGGEYFKQYSDDKKISFTGDFRPSTFSNSSNLSGNSKDLTAGNNIDIWRANVHSSISWTTFDQENPSGLSFQSDSFTWFEQGRLFLPMNFRGLISYRLENNSNQGSEQRDLSATRKDFTGELTHRLYESLNNTYQFHYSSTNSNNDGGSTGTSNSLVTNYTKTIPGGRLLAGFNIGRSVTNSAGVTSILNEPYSGISVPGSFVLRQQEVDGSSIKVFVKDPLPPNELFELQENIHYTLRPSAGTFEVNVFTLPAQFPVPGTYDFVLNYALTSGDFKIATNVAGYNVSFNLLHDVLYPYHTYTVVSSDVLAGVFSGQPLDTKTTIFGLTYHQKSLRLQGEYQKLDWNISPRRVWRGEFDYVGAFSTTFTYRATLEYEHRRFLQGTLQNTDPYTEQLTSASANISKQLFTRSLLFSAGGNYTRTQGLTDGNAYSFNSSVSWKVGKLDLSLGATGYHSDVRGLITVPTRRTHQYYYFNLKRNLF